MLRGPLRRAVALSLGALLLFAGTAAADSVQADSVIPIVDRNHFLGDVAPGATVSADVRFVVTCIGLQHIDPGQSVVLTGNGGVEPLDGRIVSASTATLARLEMPWAPDGQGCPDPVPSYPGGTESHVVLRAPTAVGTHVFTVQWSRSLTPVGANDANAFGRSATSINFSLRVVPNAPPVLSVPASFQVEGDTTGGWTAAWSVSAVDAEDDPDPTPSCTPAAGSVLPLGTTTVSCAVTDSVGAPDSKTFDVTVVDTTAPSIVGLPAAMTVTTQNATGRRVDFATPGASDIVDPAPSVACAPSTGSHFDVGTTTVTCTATDSSGRQASGTFRVTVVYDPPPPPPPPADSASAIWLEPVAGSGSTFVANRGRTIPVKVRLFVDDQERTTGDASLRVAACGTTTAAELPLTRSGGRWNLSLDTSAYPTSCYTVSAWIGDALAGSFTLELRGDAAANSVAKRTPIADRGATPTTKPKLKKTR